MISPRKIRANRSNARFSTGPRTRAGKATVAKNALRHGLSLPLAMDPPLSAMIGRLTEEIAGAAPTPQQHQLAREVAQAQFGVVRVRSARHDLLLRLMADFEGKTAAPDTFSVRISLLIPKLAAMDRYERRALSRRRSAIRALDNVSD